MPQSDPSRTEQATPKRRDKARQEGNVPKSQELSKVLVLMAGLVCLRIFFGILSEEITGIFKWFTGAGMGHHLNEADYHNILITTSASLAKILLPIFLCLAVISFLSVRIQVGNLWTTKVFTPKMSKFNPISGISKIFFSSQTVVRLARSLFMAVAVAIAPYIVLKSLIPELIPMFYSNVESIVGFMLKNGMIMVIYALIPMTIIGIADLLYTRWDYEENLKMTKDETKDEHKQSEGDPEIKGRQRKKMFSVMQNRMLQKVPEADVVITNPTHYAVALKYNPMEAPAPVVLAKGVDHLARKIKELARENDVPVKENKPLAQALYKSVEIGETIPEELYQAVASILAQLYKYKQQKH